MEKKAGNKFPRLHEKRSLLNKEVEGKSCVTKPNVQNCIIENTEVLVYDFQYHSDLSSGFKEDCELVLLEFATQERYDYKTFAELWRNMKFGRIFLADANDNIDDIVAFLENCFFQVMKYLVYSTNVFIQVGAFYMMYSIYFSQPIGHMVKVRWPFNQYSILLKLLEQVQPHTSDFAFIFNKLQSSAAFLLVAEPRQWGFEPKYKYEEKQLKDDIFGHDISFTRIKQKMFTNDFYGVACMEDVYKEYQERLKEYLEEHPECKDSFICETSTLIDDLKRNCEKFESNLKAAEQHAESDNAKDCDSIYVRRQAIINKATKLKNPTFRSS